MKRLLLSCIILVIAFFIFSGQAFAADVDGSNWMSGLPGDRYIYEFNIPGTHDSGTKNPFEVFNIPVMVFPVYVTVDIGPFLATFAQCQDLLIKDQLDAGVRAFDLRITDCVDTTDLPDGTLLLAHGNSDWFCFRGKNDDGSFITLKDTLDTMRSFLRDHPTEALLVSVRCEFDDSDYSTNVWAGIKETVQEYSDFLYMENNWPTLDQLRGKALLCTSDTNSLGLDILQINLGNTQETIDCSQTVDGDKVTLFYENHWDLGRYEKNDRVKQYVNSLDESLGDSDDPHITKASMLYSSSNKITLDFWDIAEAIIAAWWTGDYSIVSDEYQPPCEIASVVNPTLTDLINASPDDRYFGFVMTDFAGKTAETIWRSNYRFYDKYQIRYVNADGDLLHRDAVKPGDETTTYLADQGIVWVDRDHPEQTYCGTFTPKGTMTLQQNVELLKFDQNGTAWVQNWPDPIAFMPNPSVKIRLPDDIPKAYSAAIVFMSWNTKPDGTGKKFYPGETITLSDSCTLYAKGHMDFTQYTLYYNPNGGTDGPDTVTISLYDTYNISDITPVYPGMIFRGWTTHPESPEVEYVAGDVFHKETTDDFVVLYALWEIDPAGEPIHITLDANGLKDAVLPVEEVWADKSGKAELPYAYALPGSRYAFRGWSSNPAASKPEYAGGQEYVFDKSTRLYAIWGEAETLTLSFRDPLPDAASGIPEPITVTSSMSRNVQIPDNIPQKSGRIFTGWNTAADGSGTPYAPGAVITLDRDTELWAQWITAGDSWVVVYNANGGTKAPGPQIVPRGQDAVLTAEVPEAGKMIFRGWAKEPDGAAAYRPGDTLRYDSAKTTVVLYALWNISPVPQPIHISFNGNGAQGAELPPDIWMEQVSWVQMPHADAPAGSAYTFRGWSENREAKEPEFLAGKSYCFYKDTVLYAVWEKLDTVTLSFRDPLPDAASGMPDPITILPSMSRNVQIPDNIPQKGGRIFTGWNTAADGSGTPYAPGAVITLDRDTELWAQWITAGDSWVVVYNANGGTKAPGPQIVPRGQDAVLTAEVPEAGKMIFRGWAKEPDGAAAYRPGDTLPYDSAKTTVVLYALWNISPVPQPIHISFNGNGAQGAELPPDIWMEQVSWVQMPHADAPAGSAYTFRGWSENREAKEPEFLAGKSYCFYKDTVLYAVWEKLDTVTLSFRDPLPDAASGMPDPITILPSMSRNALIPDNIPQKGGRIFTGWNIAADGSGTPYAPGAVITLTGNTVLWAQWIPAGDSWNVIYNANGGTKAPVGQVVPRGQDAVLTTEVPEAGKMFFLGWAKEPDAAAPEYRPGDTLCYDSAKTAVVLYALWSLDPAERPFVISFDANGGLPDTLPQEMSVPRGAWTLLPAQKPSWDAQHDFKGWAENPGEAEAKWQPGDAFMPRQSTVLYALWKAHYRITEGAGSVWTKGSGKAQRFVADGNKRYFKELLVDGKPLNGDITITDGSTVAVIDASTMETLSIGSHMVTFVYIDGEATAPFTVRKKLPPTGDAGQPWLWLGLMILGGAGLGCLRLNRRKHREN